MKRVNVIICLFTGRGQTEKIPIKMCLKNPANYKD